MHKVAELWLQVGHSLERGLEVGRGELQEDWKGAQNGGAHEEALPLPDVLPDLLAHKPLQEVDDEAVGFHLPLPLVHHRTSFFGIIYAFRVSLAISSNVKTDYKHP